MVSYLRDVAKITTMRITAMPRNPCKSGYGVKIPSPRMVQINYKPTWYRIYIMQFSNAAYVNYKGKCLFVDDCDFPIVPMEKPI